MGPLDLLGSEGGREGGGEQEEEEVKQADNTVRHGGRCVAFHIHVLR